MFKNKYRIVTDKYLGYEVQVKPWWSFFWIQIGKGEGYNTNTFKSIPAAEKFAKQHRKNFVVKIID